MANQSKFQAFLILWSRKLPLSRELNKSLRIRITLGVVFPLVIILGTLTIIDYKTTQNLMLNNLSTISDFAGKVVESSILHGMIDNDTNSIQQMLDSIAENVDFEILYILKPTGEVALSPHGESIGTKLDNSDSECLPCHKLPPSERPKSIVVESRGGEKVFRSMHPILNQPACYGCHHPEERIIGMLLTDISITPYNQTLINDLKSSLMVWGMVIGLIGIIVYFLLNKFIIEDILRLVAQMKEYTLGIRPSGTPKREDEIGQLETALHNLIHEIDFRQEENLVLTHHLEKQNKQRGELLTRLITAQEDERKRLARDLHDDLGQTLGGFAFLLEGIQPLIYTNPQKAIDQLTTMRKLINESSEKMHEIIMDLRPALLDDLGLVPASKRLAERVLSGKKIEFRVIDDHFKDRLPPEIELPMYRVIQEAFSNCVKHSNASQISLEFLCQDGLFTCKIKDNGQGLDGNEITKKNEEQHNFGILGMRERITQCGGDFQIHSTPARGTTISITIPLKENHREE